MRRLDRYRVDPEEEMAEPGFAPARPAPAVAALLRMQATAGNQLRTGAGEGAFDVFAPSAAIELNLRSRLADASGGIQHRHVQQPAQLRGQEGRLVVAALALARLVQRQRHDGVRPR